jgi:tetratricopeptide (TPR) repeat protein
MEIKGLLVDLNNSNLAEQWQEKLAGHEIPFQFVCVSSSAEALAMLAQITTIPMVIFSNEMSNEVSEILRAFQASFGPLSDFQAIVCSDPLPNYMASVYEFGIEQFIGEEAWHDEVAALARLIHEKISDEQSPEFKTLQLATAVRSSDAKKIEEAKQAMGDLASYDFRAAYTSGKASEAAGNYDEAMNAYRTAGGMNKMFRPTSTSLGEACLITGKVDEAIAIFQRLEKSNPRDIDRKSNLASAFIEKGDMESASKYAAEAEALSPGSSRVAEIKAQVLLGKGDIQGAFGLMDQMSNVGPYFAAKLNDLGIKLSQSGKGKSALALYQKAHKIVRADLKYKISLNAALACRRLQDFDMSLKYVARCAKEFGSYFPKLVKIRDTIVKEKSQQAETPVSDPVIDDESKKVV